MEQEMKSRLLKLVFVIASVILAVKIFSSNSSQSKALLKEIPNMADDLKFNAEILSSTTSKFNITENGQTVTNQRFIQLLQNDHDFIKELTKVIGSHHSKDENSALFFESKPMTKDTLDQTYEFVLISTSAFTNADQDDYSFAQKFSASSKEDLTIKFYNLGRDAMLVVPKPKDKWKNKNMEKLGKYYVHLQKFLNDGEPDEIISFWETCGQALETRVNEVNNQNVWFSTCGTGVYYLHVRLDSRPKYYSFSEYRQGRVREAETKYSRN